MPVPKRKRSRARRDKRFANKGMKVKTIAECQNCKAPLLPHQPCKMCGYYKGVKVLSVKLDRAIRRLETRQATQARRQAQSGAPAAE